MDAKLMRSIIDVIKAEEKKRSKRRSKLDANLAYDHWLFNDLPFVNELYLMLLVAISHQIEKELLLLAARAGDGATEMTRAHYDREIESLLNKKNAERWKTIEKRLSLQRSPEYTKLRLLRLLANSYKHNPFCKPSKKLLEEIDPETHVNYAALPNSQAIMRAFCGSLGLENEAGYSRVAEEFVTIFERFLAKVKGTVPLRPLERKPVSLRPQDAEA